MNLPQKQNVETLASICITSYNRINELMRCLDSIDSTEISKIEIIISEDNSPLHKQIEAKVLEYKKTTNYNIIFNSNKQNLGYDRNLEKLIHLSKGKYIIFISDDDCFIEGMLDQLLNFLKKQNVPFLYTSFLFMEDNTFKRKYNSNMNIEKGINSAKRYIYDAILFSGLVFRRSLISDINAIRFINLNYFQIYVSLMMLYNHGGYYLNIPLIRCIGDGENAYGKTDLSGGNNLLADRTSIYSDLAFHEGLIKTIRLFDQDNNTDILNAFKKEYSLRSYRGLSKARNISRKEFNVYWIKLNSLDIELIFIVKIYYILLSVLGSLICDFLFYLPKKILCMQRKNQKNTGVYSED